LYDVIGLVNESELLRLLSDEKCRDMLLAIQKRSLSISDLMLSRKQFYSRLHDMKRFTLIKKANGVFAFTSFGRVIFHHHMVLKAIINEYWKLKAVDVLVPSDIPESERDEIVGALIENENLREFFPK
jgi:predicted transcriptional regulator